MVGHLFGYEAALSIDAQARPLREARVAIEAAVSAGPDSVIDRLRPDLQRAIEPFLAGLRQGSYNGNLEAATAVRLVSLLRYATGVLPLESYELESGKIGAPSAVIGDLLDALNSGIDELTRPVDAVKHQAKTVTVGHLPQRGRPLRRAPRQDHPVGRRGPRHPGLQGPADSRSPGRGGGRGGRIHPLPDRLAVDRLTHHRRGRPGRRRHDAAAFSHRDRPPAARHQAPGRRGTGGDGGAWAPATVAR